MNNLKDIHNPAIVGERARGLFYQDFNEQFEGYTQRSGSYESYSLRCFIRISMNNLKDIHNRSRARSFGCSVVLSGFQ